MEKNNQADFNTLSLVIKYLPIKKYFELAIRIKNRYLSKILLDMYYQHSATYIVSIKDSILFLFSVPYYKKIGEIKLPNYDKFYFHTKNMIRNYCFFYLDKKIFCLQFEPFNFTELFDFKKDIDDIYFISLGKNSFNAIVKGDTLYKYDHLKVIAKITLTKKFILEPSFVDDFLFQDIISNELLIMNMKTLYIYNYSFQMITNIKIISKEYIIIDYSQNEQFF